MQGVFSFVSAKSIIWMLRFCLWNWGSDWTLDQQRLLCTLFWNLIDCDWIVYGTKKVGINQLVLEYSLSETLIKE